MLRLIITVSLFALLLGVTPGDWYKLGSAAASSAQCQYVIAPVAQSFGARGGTGSLSILAANTCSWTATSNAPWITFTSAVSGSGLGRVNYSVIANTGAARLYGGTGLGLPITKGLIEAHHGELVIDTAPDRGTRVRVTLPPQMAAANPPAPARARLPSEPTDTRAVA